MEHLSLLSSFDTISLKKIIIKGLNNIFGLGILVSYPLTIGSKEVYFSKIKELFNNSKKPIEFILTDKRLCKYLFEVVNIQTKDENTCIVKRDEVQDQYVKDLFETYDISSYILYKIYDKGILKEFLVGFILDEKRFSDNIENLNKYRFLFESANYVFKNTENESESDPVIDDVHGQLLRVSHDLNNILTPALGALELIKCKNNPDTSEEMKLIELCIKDAVDIINHGKSSDKKETLNTEIIEIDKVITDSFLLTRHKFDKNNIIIKVDLKSHSRVFGDSTELREVFINIINNAIDAMPNGGTLKLRSYIKGGFIFIEIEDSGIGIKDEYKVKIFKPFFTTKGNKGTGIGLSICKDIINKHGGDIYMSSQYGGGSCFSIKLPLIEDRGLYEDCINIMVIDDDPKIRFIISSLVKKVFNGPVEQCTPNEAYEKLEEKKYNIVISDLFMPDIDGITLGNHIKNRYKKIYFCIMTGVSSDIKNKQNGVIDYILKKPMDIKQLENMKLEYENFIRSNVKEG